MAKTAAIALVVGSAIYALSKPDTQVDKPVLTNGQQETAGASRVA
ncbi:hypothetical protein [Wolbachia endosymbiont of Trichogramma pretiosum]|nr:hypothetical protein [Wolbachia endosymbiont of Trichogramma pretiosum]OCA06647.1 hypothetical protein wTpre_987 [Wolbachia endosymbiont of Trichogramma pretiosum]